MDDVRLVVIDRQDKAQERKDARAKISDRLRRGELPTFAEVAEARGLVLRERRDSIFSDAWVPLALLFLLIGFLSGRNVALLSLGLILLLVYGVSTWWQQNALVGVTYEREFDRTRVFPGEPIEMTLKVANRKPHPPPPRCRTHACGYKLANDGRDTRAIQAYLGHRNINHTVRYNELSPERFRGFWED